MYKLSLGILDTNLNLIGIVDEVEEFNVITNLNTASAFSLQVALTSDIANLLEMNNYIVINNQKSVTEAYIIEYKNILLNSDGSLSMKIQGRDLLSLLNRRVVTKLWNFPNNEVSEIVTDVISNEIITSNNRNRNINNLVINEMPSRFTTTYATSQLYVNLLSEITAILNSLDLGISIKVNLLNKQFIINVFEGADLSLTQSKNSPVIFSSELNNIMSQNFMSTTKNYINAAYVYGEIGESNKEEMCLVGNSNIGMYRYETSLECNQQGLTKENYIQAFENSGEIMIKNNDLNKCFCANFNIKSDYKYNKDFKIGDQITCISSEWNIYEDLQITQVNESWSNNGYSLTFKLGNDIPIQIR